MFIYHGNYLSLKKCTEAICRFIFDATIKSSEGMTVVKVHLCALYVHIMCNFVHWVYKKLLLSSDFSGTFSVFLLNNTTCYHSMQLNQQRISKMWLKGYFSELKLRFSFIYIEIKGNKVHSCNRH